MGNLINLGWQKEGRRTEAVFSIMSNRSSSHESEELDILFLAMKWGQIYCIVWELGKKTM